MVDMQLIDRNPFSICSWCIEETNELRSTEGNGKREAWDDRIDNLFGSPIYQEHLEDVGDPLFWAPLIARRQGMRMEEILPLGPDDSGSDRGIPYLRIRHTIISGVKTLSSERTFPIHPRMIEIALLKLVEMRRKEGHIRPFPFLDRGKGKGIVSSTFSKCFACCRRTNACCWPGLDFHALRTTFHHDLLGNDKSDAIRCRLMGHNCTDEGVRSYGQNLGIGKLARRVASVVVDISMIRRRFDTPSACINARAKERGLRVVGQHRGHLRPARDGAGDRHCLLCIAPWFVDASFPNSSKEAMMGGISFSDEFKRDAVAQITERGCPVRDVAGRLGVGPYSLYAWRVTFAEASTGEGEKDIEIRRPKRELARAVEERAS